MTDEIKWKRSDIDTLIVLMGCYIAHQKRDCMSFEAIYQLKPAPLKIIYAVMEREVNKGLLDYGVSLRTAFLTEKGLEVLHTLAKEAIN